MCETRHIKLVIEEHFNEIHSIKDISKFVPCSTESLRKRFVTSEHIPIGTFIRIKKVEHAKKLLSTTNMSCKKVAQAIGYSRGDVASRTFRQVTGQSMSSFQKCVSKK